MNQPTLAVVLKGYPRLSETFIAQEIRNLERAGFQVILYSLRHPTDRKTHPIHDEIQARIVYLPEYLYQEPVRVLRGWLRVRRFPGYPSAARLFWRDLKHDLTPNRIRRFGQALVLAAELADNTPALYAHFLHTPASVTFYAAMIRGLPWACSAHAKDIYTTPDWEIRGKLDHCQWLTTCTRSNYFHLRKFCSDPEKVQLNYHGVDLGRFRYAEPTYFERDGSAGADPVVLLSVGRAVEKKGYAAL
ncbi:MAG: colanic acid biosynthesis glycosyltransferase WcaL, partial [Gammaproteobacteria bacterium]